MWILTMSLLVFFTVAYAAERGSFMHGGEQSNCRDCHGEAVGGKVKCAYYHEAVSVAEAVRKLATSSKLPSFTDSFPAGRPKLRWVFVPFFNQDNFVGAKDRAGPSSSGTTALL